MEHQIVSDYTEVSSAENVKVYLRVRPTEKSATADEQKRDAKLLSFFDDDPGKITVVDANDAKYGSHDFRFDGIFKPATKQEAVFEKIGQPMVQRVLSGFNGCIFVSLSVEKRKCGEEAGSTARNAISGMQAASLLAPDPHAMDARSRKPLCSVSRLR